MEAMFSLVISDVPCGKLVINRAGRRRFHHPLGRLLWVLSSRDYRAEREDRRKK